MWKNFNMTETMYAPAECNFLGLREEIERRGGKEKKIQNHALSATILNIKIDGHI